MPHTKIRCESRPATLDAAVLSRAKLEIGKARFPAETMAFCEDKHLEGRYSTHGRFSGVGTVIFSVPEKVIEFRGFRRVRLPRSGEEIDEDYELFSDSFDVTALDHDGEGRFDFSAVRQSENGYNRRFAVGAIRFEVDPTGSVGDVVDFELDELGQMLAGVMNRYTLATSNAARALLDRLPGLDQEKEARHAR